MYIAVSRIIILAARDITCGKNDRSKMKDSGMGEKRRYTFTYFIAIFVNRIELLTCLRKHYESHTTFPLVFTEVDLYLIPFKRPILSLSFIVCTGILYKTLCVFLSTIFIPFACTWKYMYIAQCNCVLHTSYIQCTRLLLLAGIHYWVKCGFTYISSLTLDELWFNPGYGG